MIDAETYEEKRRNMTATAILALEEVAEEYGIPTTKLLRMCVEEYGKFLDDMVEEMSGDGD